MHVLWCYNAFTAQSVCFLESILHFFPVQSFSAMSWLTDMRNNTLLRDHSCLFHEVHNLNSKVLNINDNVNLLELFVACHPCPQGTHLASTSATNLCRRPAASCLRLLFTQATSAFAAFVAVVPLQTLSVYIEFSFVNSY